jgi:hypothetical protein
MSSIRWICGYRHFSDISQPTECYTVSRGMQSGPNAAVACDKQQKIKSLSSIPDDRFPESVT